MVQDGRGERLCVLALPADMGVAEFCSFVGAYLPQIKEMRLVRREEGRTACMVLLRFMTKANTDEFYLHFNNKPVRCRHRLKADDYFVESETSGLNIPDCHSSPPWSRISSVDSST